MARVPPVVRLSEMEPGQSGDFFAQLAERTRGTTRDGKPFFTCRFRDSRRSAVAMIWADVSHFEKCQSEWKEGACYKLRATYGEHERYGPQLDIENIRPVSDADQAAGFNLLDFIERSRFDPEKCFHDLRQLVEDQIRTEPLRRLTLLLLDRHAARLKILPASAKNYHPFAGGLVEHTLSVTRLCLDLAARYGEYYAELKPPLNRDLLAAGAVLHEIGRVAELDGSVPPQQTIEGRIHGHVILGRDLVRDAAREIPDFPPEMLLLLEHLNLTHLHHLEWGSPRLPVIPESLILHHVDDLDAKMEMYVRCLVRDTSDGPFTANDSILKKGLFKGRTL